MNKVQLKKGISTDDISRWGHDSGDLLIKATRDSKFAAFCEGIALGKLSELRNNASNIRLLTTFPILPTVDSTGTSDLGILDGLFGLSIAYGGASVIDPNGTDQRKPLLDTLWNHVQETGGVLGDAKKCSIVFRDPDYSIPKCLRVGNRNSFPEPQLFKSVLKKIGSEIGAERNFGLSMIEDDVMTFLYEAARNSHEHARWDSDHRAIKGIRGMSVEKYKFSSKSEIDKRSDIPPLLSKYFCLSLESSRRNIFLTFSVTDLGPGIHNTLPARPGEGAWERLMRAFLPGQSRKPTGSDINRGMGLKKMLDAARRLRAFLFVRSAELLGYLDFSTTASGPSQTLSVWPGAEPGNAGTSITIVWPIADQIDEFASFGAQ